jgi:AraC-like DNA-binding protein
MSSDDRFEKAVHRFAEVCQVLAEGASSGCQPLPNIARALAGSLPAPRTCSEFLMLRSLLVEFAMRAVQADHSAWPVVVTLATLQPPGDLGAAILTCLSQPPVRPRVHRTQRTAVPRPVASALAEIHARCCDHRTTPATIAALLGVSETHLSRVLRAHTGSGLRRTLKHARLEAGRHLLSHSQFSVKEITDRAGYTSTSQFDRDFRRHVGVTPTGYRRSVQTLNLRRRT